MGRQPTWVVVGRLAASTDGVLAASPTSFAGRSGSGKTRCSWSRAVDYRCKADLRICPGDSDSACFFAKGTFLVEVEQAQNFLALWAVDSRKRVESGELAHKTEASSSESSQIASSCAEA